MIDEQIIFQPPTIPTPADVARFAQLLFVGRGIDLQSTADQPISKMFVGANYSITSVIGLCKTGGATVACVGGIYTAATKGGTPLVGAAQSWIGLSAAGKRTQATLAGVVDTDVQTAAPLYFSLTTGSTGAATANVYAFGVILD